MHQTPLTNWHREHGGRLVDFAGWEMPIQYSTIVEEHQAVRTGVGLFDISHMGRLAVRGEQATDFLNYVTTIDVSRLKPGRIRYALATNEQGGVQDDILVYRLLDEYLVVVNASNREKILADWQSVQADYPQLELVDQTFDTAMIAVQGPLAVVLIQKFCPAAAELKYYHCIELPIGEEQFLVSRTGYTGEDGFELIGPNAAVQSLWSDLLAAGTEQGGMVCGLGCRDTLRLEAGMPLYGHELNEQIDPITAGLSFAVHLDKAGFRGQKVLQNIAEQGPERVRVGLELHGKRIAREHAVVLDRESQPIGEVSSGTFSPTLQKSIAMAYVPAAFSETGTEVIIDIRGTKCPAFVTALPFYQRTKA